MTTREYRAYLLRLWRESKNSGWRVLLVNPNSGEKKGFTTVADLIPFLENELGNADEMKETAVSSNK